MPLEIGPKAPAFKLPTNAGGKLSLRSLKGKKVVLYFYLKDMTPGCTRESEEFWDRLLEFKSVNTIILGVSKNNVKRHDSLKAKYQLPFTLISDEEVMLSEAYDLWHKKSCMAKNI